MIGLLALFAGAVLLAYPAWVVPPALNVRGASLRFVASLVVAAAEAVAVMIVLSLLHALTAPGILAAEAVVAGGVAALRLPFPRPRGSMLDRRRLALAIREHPPLAALLAITGVALGVELYYALAIAPNDFDSLSYHLSRAAYWLQYDSALRFAGGSPNQLGAPPNAELLMAWTMALTDGDRFVQLVQWLSLLGLVACIFSGTRLLGLDRPRSAFVAALFACMPLVLLESSTPQNDLVASFFIAAGLLFGLRALRWRRRGELALSALAFGLAVGTKGTALIAAPALLMVLAAAARRWRTPISFLRLATAAVVAGVLALGSFVYVSNLAETGNLFGGVREQVQTDSVSAGVARNAARDAWTFVDFPDGRRIGWAQRALRPVSERVFAGLPDRPDFGGLPRPIDTQVDDSGSAYGLLGLLLLVPTTLVVLLRRGTARPRRVLAAAALVYLASAAAATGYNPWVGRILMPVVVLAAPLLGWIGSRGWMAAAAVLIALSGVVPSLRENLRPRNLLQMDRISQQSLGKPGLEPVLRRFRGLVPADATIGYMGDEESFDYPLFGAHFQRRIIRLEPTAGLARVRARRDLAGVFYAQTTGLDGPRLVHVALPRARGLVRLGGPYAFLPRSAIRTSRRP